MNNTSPFTVDAARALEAFPLRPLPHLIDIELDAVSVASSLQCDSIVDIVPIAEGTVGLVAVRCTGSLHALLARDIAEHHLRAGAETHTVLACVVQEMNARYPESLLAGLCIAVFDSHDNRLCFSSTGALGPHLFRRDRKGFATKRELSRARVQPLGAEVDQIRIHLRQGDWFVAGTEAARDILTPRGKGRRANTAAFCAALSKTTVASLIERVGTKARALAEKGALKADVALVALRVPLKSTRNQVLRELGFEPNEPVHLARIHYYEQMDRVASRVLRGMDRQGFRDIAIRKMKIALAELLINALEHGNRKDPTKRVVVGYTADAGRVKVSIMDEGDGFDPAAVPDPTLEGNIIKDRGRGLFLARHFVDQVQFNKMGNRVTIVKHFHP